MVVEFDRDHIVEYLLFGLKSPQAASHFMDELDETIARLADSPFIYAEVAEPRLLRMGYRKALFMNYLAIYKVENDVVYIARVFHQSQDFARLL